jgi:hypothetical protein
MTVSRQASGTASIFDRTLRGSLDIKKRTLSVSGAIPHAARQKLKPAPPASKPSPRIKTARHFSKGYEIGGEDRARRSENGGTAWGEVEAKFRANGAEVAGDQWGRRTKGGAAGIFYAALQAFGFKQ